MKAIRTASMVAVRAGFFLGTAAVLVAVWPVEPAQALLKKVFDLEQPADTALSPDGQNVYVTSFDSPTLDALVVLHRDPATGFLTFLERHTGDKNAVDGLDGPTSPVVSPDGAHVYVAEFDEDAIAVFSRDAGTGGLELLETVAAGGAGPDNLRMSPDGAHLYALSLLDGGTILVFSRDAVTGALTLIQSDEPTAEWGELEMSPGGEHVYVSSSSEDAVGVFERDITTGLLTLVEVERDGVGGVQGMDGPSTMTVSPDGVHLYVSAGGARFVIFDRDVTTGALAFAQVQAGGGGLRISPDGAHLYVNRVLPSRVVAYGRNAATGELTLIQTIQAGAQNPGLRGPRRPVFSADGIHLYLGSFDDDVVTMLVRDADTGQLTFVPEQFGGSFPQPGKRLTIKSTSRGDTVASWNVKGPGVIAPAVRFMNDPRCSFGGTLASSIRFFSPASGQDTGEIDLPCSRWQRIGSGEKGFKYKDGTGSTPCRRLTVRDGLLKAKCGGRGSEADFPYILTQGVDQGVVNVVLSVGTLRYCTAFDSFNGATGADGKKFRGKYAPPPGSCPPPLGSPGGAFLDRTVGSVY